MSRKQTVISVEEDGKTYYLNLTAARKLKGTDGAPLFRKEGESYVFDHYRRVSLLRKDGYV